VNELVDFLVNRIIGGGYEVILIEDENEVNIKVFADKEKFPRLIGKFGKTAKAIRSIVRACSQGAEKRYDVSFDER